MVSANSILEKIDGQSKAISEFMDFNAEIRDIQEQFGKAYLEMLKQDHSDWNGAVKHAMKDYAGSIMNVCRRYFEH